MLTGIKEFLIICKSKDTFNYKNLGNGEFFSIKIMYEIQEQAKA